MEDEWIKSFIFDKSFSILLKLLFSKAIENKAFAYLPSAPDVTANISDNLKSYLNTTIKFNSRGVKWLQVQVIIQANFLLHYFY